ncbi:DNA cytosine methyltransferase [Sphingosinicella sp. BN140058]|uniref:DNA cytosine methyltransferase n=1 Tax=Sphingosinicella sp. BN140058 TaxID=1892855 RepID=UPI001012D9F8|nr:DNA cytosine methyltransferase [Sphingosinicella sp. BN140058]QAY80369.1 DNA cytosine methyltransferase [Sphingosinicella sp. BN140058]
MSLLDFRRSPQEEEKVQALSVARVGADKRGTRRIWLEGRKLARAGFVPAARYQLSVDHDSRTVELRLAANGERLVSRKARGEEELPVIDLANGQVLQSFEGLETVKVRFENGAVIITPTATDLRRLERAARLRSRLDGQQPLHVGSVSTGLGVLARAMHEGLQAAGLDSELLFSVEIESTYVEQCAKANPVWGSKTIAVEAPMQEIAFDAAALLALPKVEVLEAGLPCVGASLAGRAKKSLAKAEDDPKAGHLVAGFLAIAAAVNPAVILIENVPAYMNTASFSILSNQLTEWGYDVQSTILRGADYGCLEHRDRMALVAVTHGVEFDIQSLVADRGEPQLLGSVLEDVPDDSPLWSPMAYLRDKEDRDIAAGKGFRMQVYGPDAPSVAVLGRGYAKVRSTEPKLQHPTDPALLRQLTPAEHARVKGISEKMIEGLGITAAHEMLGQSILPKPFRALARHLGDALQAWQAGVGVPKAAPRAIAIDQPAPRIKPVRELAPLPLFA